MGDEPLVRLPDRVVLSREEAATVLFALDSAEEQVDPFSSTARQITVARVLLTSKLWQELGDLLEDDGEE